MIEAAYAVFVLCERIDFITLVLVYCWVLVSVGFVLAWRLALGTAPSPSGTGIEIIGQVGYS